MEAGRVKTLSTKTILFTGSSSIRKWDLKKEFPGLETVNLGFGGSRMADLNSFANRILFPCSPTRMVVYEGDNDLHEGASPREVIRDFEQFLAKVAGSLPQTRVYFLAVKPSPSRLKEMDQQKEFNRLLRELCEQSRGKAIFVDTFTPILGSDGKPDPSLFLEDKLHLNDKGYSRWKTTLEPLLK